MLLIVKSRCCLVKSTLLMVKTPFSDGVLTSLLLVKSRFFMVKSQLLQMDLLISATDRMSSVDQDLLVGGDVAQHRPAESWQLENPIASWMIWGVTPMSENWPKNKDKRKAGPSIIPGNTLDNNIFYIIYIYTYIMSNISILPSISIEHWELTLVIGNVGNLIFVLDHQYHQYWVEYVLNIYCTVHIFIILYIFMLFSPFLIGGQNHLPLVMDMAKVGGPLSVVTVYTSVLCVNNCKHRVSVSGWSPIGCEGFHTNLKIASPLSTTLVFC